KAEQIWLRGIFWERIKKGQLSDAWKMLDFDSQFLAQFTNAFTFNFGRALDREKISEKILRGVGPSLALTVPMFIGTVVISISFALIVAFLRGTVWDHTIVILCVAGMSIPYLSFIIFGQYYFAYKLDWFPIFYDPSRPIWLSIILPSLIGIVAGLGSNLRFYRTIMLDEIRSDYVRTAFAKGLSARKVLFKHVLKNAMIPIVTNTVLSIPYLILGSLLLERFFGIPGLGYLMIDAINSRDFFVLNAMTFIMALLIAFFTLVTDVCYAWVDPRVKFD
ncbi:MAG: ABC transporter permease, partial [Planctomycetota bacterium]